MEFEVEAGDSEAMSVGRVQMGVFVRNEIVGCPFYELFGVFTCVCSPFSRASVWPVM